MPHHAAAAPSGAWFRPSVRHVRVPVPVPAAAPALTARPSPPEVAAGPRTTWLERIDRWFWRLEQKRVEDYLAQSVDAADLEQRLRRLERRASSI